MNVTAKEMGIQISSSMDTAYTLNSQIVSFERDEEKEFATLSHLAQWAYQFTPGVSIKAPHIPTKKAALKKTLLIPLVLKKRSAVKE